MKENVCRKKQIPVCVCVSMGVPACTDEGGWQISKPEVVYGCHGDCGARKHCEHKIRRKWFSWDLMRVDLRWLSEWDLTVCHVLFHTQTHIQWWWCCFSHLHTAFISPVEKTELQHRRTGCGRIPVLRWLHDKAKGRILLSRCWLCFSPQQAGNEKQIFQMCRFTESWHQRWMFAYRKSMTETTNQACSPTGSAHIHTVILNSYEFIKPLFP